MSSSQTGEVNIVDTPASVSGSDVWSTEDDSTPCPQGFEYGDPPDGFVNDEIYEKGEKQHIRRTGRVKQTCKDNLGCPPYMQVQQIDDEGYFPDAVSQKQESTFIRISKVDVIEAGTEITVLFSRKIGESTWIKRWRRGK